MRGASGLPSVSRSATGGWYSLIIGRLRSRQPATKFPLDIFHVLDADRQAHQPVGDALTIFFGRGDVAVRGGGGVATGGGGVAQRRAERHPRRLAQEAVDGGPAPLQVEAQHVAARA